MRRLAVILLTILLVIHQSLYASLDSAKQTVTDIEKIGITENTSPEIKQLYTELTDAIKKHDAEYAEYTNKLSENAQKMKEKEQSTTNKLIGAVGIGATGIGGMQLMSGMTEQSADADAAQDMRAYLATLHCDYGGGTTVPLGEVAVTLPSANDLFQLRSDYVTLATELKEMKATLNIAPGLEAQEILSAADTSLYDDQSIGKTGGAYTSVARALLDKDGDDAKAWAQQTEQTKSQIKTGAAIAAVGAIGSAVANVVANKDAPKEESDKIKTEHEAQKAKIETEINDAEKRLAQAVENNKQKIAEFNKLLSTHQQFLQSATDDECVKKISPEYIEHINSLKTIENDLQGIPEIKYDLATQQSAYQECMDEKRRREECVSNPAKEWNGTQCVDKAPAAVNPASADGTQNAPGADDPADPQTDADTKSDTRTDPDAPAVLNPNDADDPDRCPAVNPRMKSLNEKNRVGDFCKYGNVSNGKVYKRSDGTCSCNALACVAGYHVSGGTCVEDIADANGNCVRKSYPETNENNTTAKCTAFCKSKAQANKCNHVGVIMKHSTKECICNPSNINKSCAKQEYPLPSANTSCATLCNQKNTALECMPNGKSLKKTKSDGSQWCVCNATDDDITLKYYSVCNADKGKTGKKEYCVSDVFNWTNVQLMQATALAREYARVKHGNSIKCSNEYRKSWNDDYLKCAALNGSAYYEFKFDDVKESHDVNLQVNLIKAICTGIYDGKWRNNPTPQTYGYICDNIDQATCNDKVAQTASKFGFKANWAPGYQHCAIKNAIYENTTSIAQIAGIDSFIFYTGIQIQANSTIEASLREYVRGVMGNRMRTFSCVQNPRQMSKIDGHTVRGTTDDVLRCTINGDQEVDFVFDDTSEFDDTYHEGGMQNIDCKVMGGEYNGRECMYLGKAQCEKMQVINVSKCPTCKQIYWDVKDKVCRMPSAEAAKDLENNIEVATLVAAAAGGVVVTIATGGTAAPALAFLAVETAGAAMEIYQTVKIHDAGDEFLDESRKCTNSSCAEQMLRTNLQHMSNLASDLPDAQVNGIDAELARLAGLLQSDSDFYKRLLAQGTSTAANQKDLTDLDSWEPEQIWRAIGGVLQLASIFKSVFGWAKKLTRTTTALRNGINTTKNTTKAVTKTDDVSAALRKARKMSTAEELETVGVRDMGNNQYKDMRTQRYISHEEVLNRIDNISYDDAMRTADTATDATTSGTKSGTKSKNTGGSNTPPETKVDVPTGTFDDTADATRTADRATDTAGNTKRGTRATTGASHADDAAHGAENALSTAEAERVRVVMNGENMRVIPGNNAYISSAPMSNQSARSLVGRLHDQGYAAASIRIEGHANGAEVVVAMTKEEAARIGAYVRNGAVYRSIDNSANMARLRAAANGQELGRLNNGMRVSIDSMADFGSVSGRPVIMVRVGERKIPFYASSGLAGKTNVPTGRWEFFGGIGPDGGWFNKGTLNDIVGHYGSPELRQIANILDSKIGDLRNTESVLESLGRESIGGLGKVASMQNEQGIAVEAVNQYLRHTPSGTSRNGIPFRNNLDDIKRYLSSPPLTHADDVANAGRRADDAAREAQRLAEDARIRANTPTESQLDDMITRGMRNKAASEAAEAANTAGEEAVLIAQRRAAETAAKDGKGLIHDSLMRETFYTNILRRESRDAIHAFATDIRAGATGLDAGAVEAINGQVARALSKDVDYYSIYNSSNYILDGTRQNLWTSVINPVTYKEKFSEMVDIAQAYERASIPISSDGHVFALIKNGDYWGIVDQFGPTSYKAQKDIVKNVLKEKGIQNIVENTRALTGESANRLDCFAYSSQVSYANLMGERKSVAEVLSNPFKHAETDDWMEMMQSAAKLISDDLSAAGL